ncbi:hypothetical protein BG006_001251 [Podila minutissima]|uniref:Crinkler effector protein N-terminal domain-containing protein n=1 Tax=Podila minutissima TaxID=64525 RepID=A0A9P5SAG8_9FUNG|nr:hypothetical protein BG006_001251 [Podila minutissima]
MDNNPLTLFCLVDGEGTSNAFSVKIASTDTVDDLKELIKNKKPVDFEHVDANNLSLWHVSVPDDDDNDLPVLLNSVPEKKKLKATAKLSKVFGIGVPEDTIHVIVQRPQVHAPVPSRALTPLPGSLSVGSRPSSPLSGDLRADVKKITDRFFATGSPASIFLHAYGCGKTRSMIEMLCLQWGFYFNAAKKDLGSNDLSQLAEFLDTKTSEEQSPRINTVFARKMTLVLFLSRLLVLKYCLQVPNCRQTFSSDRWAILQACSHMFRDVFMEFFRILYDQMKERSFSVSVMESIVRDELLSVRDSLAVHKYTNFSRETKLRLVVDEAQILGDKGTTLFHRHSRKTTCGQCFLLS